MSTTTTINQKVIIVSIVILVMASIGYTRWNVMSMVGSRIVSTGLKKLRGTDDIRPIGDVYQTVKAINLDLSHVNETALKDLQQRLTKFPGKTPVYLSLDTKGYKGVQIMVGEDLFVAPCKDLIEEIKTLVAEAVRETGASSMKDMGQIMKVLMPKVAGRADNKILSDLVRQSLS